jgi:hypothetical protein
MVDGTAFYMRNSMKVVTVFDPLIGDKVPPNECGFVLRFLTLDLKSKRILIRKSLAAPVEAFFNV